MVDVCHICSAAGIQEIKDYRLLSRVTSDCRPWPRGGVCGVCRNCGIAQALVAPKWESEAKAIYKNYAIYAQSNGQEQSVFDGRSGTPLARSVKLASQLCKYVPSFEEGRLLDVGCGNGAFLQACSSALPKWVLAGSEVDGKYESQIRQIPRVENHFTCALDQIPGIYDVISFVHVLEHLPDPNKILKLAWDKLSDAGTVFVQVPDCEINPFMLLVADHCTHFSTTGLASLVQSSGFEIMYAGGDWVNKEISVLARKKEGQPSPQFPYDIGMDKKVQNHINWLVECSRNAKEFAQPQPTGIFGSSIAGTWLYGELEGLVQFFVDEDPNRFGQRHCGLPIISKEEDNPEYGIVFGLPPVLARQICQRWSRNPEKNCLAPELVVT